MEVSVVLLLLPQGASGGVYSYLTWVSSFTRTVLHLLILVCNPLALHICEPW
jgi:hypothetical protein